MKKQSPSEPIVFVIDDDVSVSESLKQLLESVGLCAELFSSAHAFLDFCRPDVASCLVLDVRLPSLTGLEFQDELLEKGISLPIIFVTGHGDIPMSVRAMKRGAVEFLTKPFRDQDLLEAVRIGLERDHARRRFEKNLAVLRANFECLTTRERQAICFISEGLSNKQIASQMGVSNATAKVHRGNLMRKMQARSLADLVRMADLLGVARAQP